MTRQWITPRVLWALTMCVINRQVEAAFETVPLPDGVLGGKTTVVREDKDCGYAECNRTEVQWSECPLLEGFNSIHEVIKRFNDEFDEATVPGAKNKQMMDFIAERVARGHPRKWPFRAYTLWGTWSCKNSNDPKRVDGKVLYRGRMMGSINHDAGAAGGSNFICVKRWEAAKYTKEKVKQANAQETRRATASWFWNGRHDSSRNGRLAFTEYTNPYHDGWDVPCVVCNYPLQAILMMPGFDSCPETEDDAHHYWAPIMMGQLHAYPWLPNKVVLDFGWMGQARGNYVCVHKDSHRVTKGDYSTVNMHPSRSSEIAITRFDCGDRNNKNTVLPNLCTKDGWVTMSPIPCAVCVWAPKEWENPNWTPEPDNFD